MKKQKTDDFKSYENGKNYNLRLTPPYYENIRLNERFFAGDQWHGMEDIQLSKPVFNIFKRIINYYISSIMSQKTTVQYSSDDVDGDPMVEAHASVLNPVQARIFEQNKMDSQLRDVLYDAGISGDGCMYAYFDNEIDSGNKVKGEIVWERVDGVNVFFGNPNDPRVNFMGRPVQPYILLSFREMVSKLKAEAKRNGIPKKEIDNIVSDNDFEYEAGDRGRIELDESKSEGKCRVVMKFYPKDVGGKTTIMCRKSTRHSMVRKEWDTKMPIYPIAWMNWEMRKNSYHGQAPGTGLVPNNIYINKQFAFAQAYTARMAFPKLIYDKSRMAPPTTRIGESIGIDSSSGGSVFDVANYLQPGQMSNQVMNVIDATFNYTKETMGATDAVMGDVNPENTSAIIATIQQSGVPLENIKARLYQFVEDIGIINNVMMSAFYGTRKMLVNLNGQKIPITFNFKELVKMRFNIRADVGPGATLSQQATTQTLDNLLLNGHIDLVQYYERQPKGTIPNVEGLIEDAKAKMEAMQQAEAMGQQPVG